MTLRLTIRRRTASRGRRISILFCDRLGRSASNFAKINKTLRTLTKREQWRRNNSIGHTFLNNWPLNLKEHKVVTSWREQRKLGTSAAKAGLISRDLCRG